jgi:hypothetical protein
MIGSGKQGFPAFPGNLEGHEVYEKREKTRVLRT